MDRHFYGERPIESDNGGGNGESTPSRPAYSDPYAYKAPVDAVLIPEQPADEIVAPEPTLNEPLDQATPMEETPFREIPRWEHAAEFSPAEERIIPDAPVIEKTAYTAPLGETLADEYRAASTPVTYTAPMAEMVTPAAPVTTPTAAPAAPAAPAAAPAALLKHEDLEHFRTRWNEIQGTFVDEPRAAVQQADALVAEVVELITQMFAAEHSSLESQWKQGEDVSTEDLRKALQHYRAFFNRLVV